MTEIIYFFSVSPAIIADAIFPPPIKVTFIQLSQYAFISVFNFKPKSQLTPI